MTNRQSEKAAENGDQERALLCNLIAAFPDAIFFLDPASTFQGCNLVFEQLFGLEAAYLVRRKTGEIFDPATATCMQQQIDAVLQSGQPRQFEHLIEPPRRSWLETHIRVRGE
jgi:PAS domain-containing protein